MDENEKPLFRDQDDEPVIPASDDQAPVVAGVGSSALGSVDVEPDLDEAAPDEDELPAQP